MGQTRGVVLGGILVCALAAPALANPVKMDTGLWEMTGEMEMMGQKMDSPKVQQCITKKDLDGTWWQDLPKDMQCKVDQKVTAKTVTWTTSCKMEGGGTMTMTGKVDYTRKSFKGSAKMTMNIPSAGEQKGTLKMAGKHIGPCKG
jgi:hypothetical protein